MFASPLKWLHGASEESVSSPEYKVVHKFPALAEALRPTAPTSCDPEVTFTRGVITLKDNSVGTEKKRNKPSRFSQPIDTGNNDKRNEERPQVRTGADGKKYIIERHSLREVRNQLYKNKFRKFKRELTGQALLLEKSNKAAANELSSRRSNLETRRISLYSRTAGSTMRRPRLPINPPKGQLHSKKWIIPARRQKHTDCFLLSGDFEFKERERASTRLRAKVNLEAFNRKIRQRHLQWKAQHEERLRRSLISSFTPITPVSNMSQMGLS